MKELITHNRSALMGFATIAILFGHTVFYGEGNINYGTGLTEIITLGFMGVDMFLFISAIGLCRSFENNSIKDFYKHRAVRILPTLFIILILFCALKRPSVIQLINPIFWYKNYWYIGFIVIMYAIFPIVYKSMDNNSSLVCHISVFTVSFLLFIPFLLHGVGVSCNPYVCSVARLPIFGLGIMTSLNKTKYLNNKKILTFMLILGVLSLYPYFINNDLGGNNKVTNYYNLILITPPILYFLGIWFFRDKYANHIFSIIGKYSLEIYLVQVTIMPQLIRFGIKYFGSKILTVVLSIVTVAIISMVVHMLSNSIVKLLK